MGALPSLEQQDHGGPLPAVPWEPVPLEGKGPDGPWTSASAPCSRDAGSPAPSNPHNPTSLSFLSVVCAGPGWLCSPRDEALLVCVVLGPAGAPSPRTWLPWTYGISHRVPWIKGTLAFEKLLTFQGLIALWATVSEQPKFRGGGNPRSPLLCTPGKSVPLLSLENVLVMASPGPGGRWTLKLALGR